MAGNQDKMKLYTVEQLLRKYDFDRIAKNKKAIEVHNNGLTKIDKELSDFVKIATNSLENLQDQVDGNITTWFFVGIPTLDSYPSNEWVTDEDKIKHLGDLYYDQDTGYAYRFALQENIYTWIKITDSDVTEALALANAAQDTADKKRRVFVATPIPPYDNGDLWFNNQEIYICQIAKEKDNVYEDGDFIIATKYTDDTLAKEVDGKLTIVSGQVTIIKEGLDEISQTVEDNKYYVDEDGNKHLISQSLSEEIQRTDLISQTVQSHSSSIQGLNPVLESEGNGQLSLPDCAGEKLLEFTVDGKIEQNGTPTPTAPVEIKSISGVENLFDINNFILHTVSSVAYESKENELILTNSDNSANSYIRYMMFKTEGLENEIFSFSCDAKTSGENLARVTFHYCDDNGTNRTALANTGNTNDGKLTCTFKLAENFTSTQTYIMILFYGSYNAGNLQGTMATYSNIQLEKSQIIHKYIPPGTNYLIEKVVGKNKLNLGNETFTKLGLTSIVNGSEWKINGTSTESNYIRNPHIISLGKFKVGTYTFHINSDDITTTNIAFQLRNVDENINFFNGNVQNKTSIFTLTKETELGVSIWNAGAGNVINGTIYLQLEEGSQATEYEKFKETISLIDLKGNKLCSNKDLTTRDSLTVKNGIASIDKKVNEVVLDTSFTISSMSTVNGKRRFKIVLTELAKTVANNAVTKLLSDRFNAISGDDTYLEKNGICVIGDTVVIYYDEINTYTNDEFKEWLTNNPVTLQYELATPETIDLGEVSIQTVQSDCTLELEEELDTDMYAKYIKNNPYNEAYSTRLDTKAQIQLSENKIESSVSETILQNTELMQGEIDSLSSNLANNYMTSEEVQNLNNLTNESLAVITNEFKQIQTSTQTQFQAITNILQNGVNLVKTTYTTIDDEGIKIAKSTDSFNSTFDNRGLKLYSYTDLMAVYTNKGAGVTNLLVTGTMDLGYSKIMKVTQNEKKYTGIFFSDAMVQTLEDFVED